jgi:hypothetical protein
VNLSFVLDDNGVHGIGGQIGYRGMSRYNIVMGCQLPFNCTNNVTVTSTTVPVNIDIGESETNIVHLGGSQYGLSLLTSMINVRGSIIDGSCSGSLIIDDSGAIDDGLMDGVLSAYYLTSMNQTKVSYSRLCSLHMMLANNNHHPFNITDTHNNPTVIQGGRGSDRIYVYGISGPMTIDGRLGGNDIIDSTTAVVDGKNMLTYPLVIFTGTEQSLVHLAFAGDGKPSFVSVTSGSSHDTILIEVRLP